jgi:hypothetical protein
MDESDMVVHFNDAQGRKIEIVKEREREKKKRMCEPPEPPYAKCVSRTHRAYA